MVLCGECHRVWTCPICGQVKGGEVFGNLYRACRFCPYSPCRYPDKSYAYGDPCCQECRVKEFLTSDFNKI